MQKYTLFRYQLLTAFRNTSLVLLNLIVIPSTQYSLLGSILLHGISVYFGVNLPLEMSGTCGRSN